MSDGAVPPHGVMEGMGAYNRYAKLQASGVSRAASFLANAAQRVVAPDVEPIVIVDYGSSQGKNSLVPLCAAIGEIRSHLAPDRPILVFHVDQPSNDFNTLFEVLDSDAQRYTRDDANIFPGAIGRSFYERVLPDDYVHLAWSSYAAVWLSRLPMRIPGHFSVSRSTGTVRAEFERQAARDWETFLALRAAELRSGGRLVVVLPNHVGHTGFLGLMDHANAVLAEMVDAGEISAEEREGMILGSYPRQKHELLAPFAPQGRFHHLSVESYETFPNPDPAWEDYERDGDKPALAERYALFFRSTFVPSLASALVARDEGRLRAFGDQMEEGLKRHLAREPAALDILVQVLVLAKEP